MDGNQYENVLRRDCWNKGIRGQKMNEQKGWISILRKNMRARAYCLFSRIVIFAANSLFPMAHSCRRLCDSVVCVWALEHALIQ